MENFQKALAEHDDHYISLVNYGQICVKDKFGNLFHVTELNNLTLGDMKFCIANDHMGQVTPTLRRLAGLKFFNPSGLKWNSAEEKNQILSTLDWTAIDEALGLPDDLAIPYIITLKN